MGIKGFSKEIFKGLNIDEIVEVRKMDLFILLVTAKSWLKMMGSDEMQIAKILASIFCENNWKERIQDEFIDFVHLMGESHEHDEDKIN